MNANKQINKAKQTIKTKKKQKKTLPHTIRMQVNKLMKQNKRLKTRKNKKQNKKTKKFIILV